MPDRLGAVGLGIVNVMPDTPSDLADQRFDVAVIGGGSASEADGPASESEGRLPPGSDDGSGGEGEGAAARAAREHAARLQARVDALERELRSAAQARRAPGPRPAAFSWRLTDNPRARRLAAALRSVRGGAARA